MLAYLFLSEVATLTQSNSLSAKFPYVHFCLQLVRNVGIAIFAGIIVFAGIAVFTGIAVCSRL